VTELCIAGLAWNSHVLYPERITVRSTELRKKGKISIPNASGVVKDGNKSFAKIGEAKDNNFTY
jgi:hypothetical protein